MYSDFLFIPAQLTANLWADIGTVIVVIVSLGTFWGLFSSRLDKKADKEEMDKKLEENQQAHIEIRSKLDNFQLTVLDRIEKSTESLKADIKENNRMLREDLDIERKHNKEIVELIKDRLK